jgi:hypothetical protein
VRGQWYNTSENFFNIILKTKKIYGIILISYFEARFMSPERNQTLKQICEANTQKFWQSLSEETALAYRNAYQGSKFNKISQLSGYHLGANRYIFLQTALKNAADENGIPLRIDPSEPKGGYYCEIEAGEFILSIHQNQRPGALPKGNKRRRLLAEYNKSISPQQLSFNLGEFIKNSEEEKTENNKLFAMLVVTPNKNGKGNPEIPAAMGLVIPDASYLGRLHYFSFEEILAFYNQQSVSENNVERKKPSLKKPPKQDEAS